MLPATLRIVLCVTAALVAVSTATLGATRRAAFPAPPSRLAAPVAAARISILIGRSVEGRPIRAVAVGDPTSAIRILVVGCIHGDEAAGISVTRRLGATPPPPGVAIWVVGDLNPDGRASHRRQNTHGVDLNRNFSYHWRALGYPGQRQYSGPRPFSEPEARAARDLILRVRPAVTLWFHQPLGLVDLSGGNPTIERRFSTISKLPLRRLTRYPGSASSWQNHRLSLTTAFVVEFPTGPLSATNATRYAKAVRQLAITLRTGQARS